MLQAHDGVLKNTSGQEANPYQGDDSPAYNSRQMEDSVSDRPEKLTRVRLVQFHKQLNEPMVSSYGRFVYELRRENSEPVIYA